MLSTAQLNNIGKDTINLPQINKENNRFSTHSRVRSEDAIRETDPRKKKTFSYAEVKKMVQVKEKRMMEKKKKRQEISIDNVLTFDHEEFNRKSMVKKKMRHGSKVNSSITSWRDSSVTGSIDEGDYESELKRLYA